MTEGVSADVRLTIAHLLVDGLEDKVVARRLGMSLRTYQRHLSSMMQDLGARNRLRHRELRVVSGRSLPRWDGALCGAFRIAGWADIPVAH